MTKTIACHGMCLLMSVALMEQSASAGATLEPDAGRVRLVLPPVIYAVPGVEVNVYFDNVVLLPDLHGVVFDVTCSHGRQQVERWTWTPGADDVGTHQFALTVRNAWNEPIAHARSVIQVTPSDAGSGRDVTLLCIGDSLTQASIYPLQALERTQQAGSPNLRLVGSNARVRVSPQMHHEGYSGWTAQRFATRYTGIARQGDSRERGSPFLYADRTDEPTLDFARYIDEVLDGRPPDMVTIFLGPNDVFHARDHTIEQVIDGMLQHYDLIVQGFRQAAPDAIIGIMLPVPPAGTQDAFGRSYGTLQTRWQYKRNQHRLVERLLETYGNRTGEQIHIVPAVVNIDTMRNYPVAQQTANAHNDTLITRLSNGVHPAHAGYRQIGDTLYTFIKAMTYQPAE